MKLIITYSLMSSYLQCQRKWYYMYIENIEKRQWKEAYIMGNMFQYGIFLLMKCHDLIMAQNKMESFLKQYLKELRKKFLISVDDERQFVEMRAMLKGMLQGYHNHYRRDLEVEKHIANEQEEIYKVFKNVRFRIKMDNIVSYKSQWYLHEGKAWNYLHSDRVNNAIRSLQIATYFYLHNDFSDTKRFTGIIFDAVQKPTIRQKQGETYRGYLKRLEKYYSDADSGKKFYKEAFDKPVISKDEFYSTLQKTVIGMEKILNDNEIAIMSFNDCGMCDYNVLCYEGDNKHNRSLFKPNEYMTNLRKGK